MGLIAIYLLLTLITPLSGDQLRIASSGDWREWQLPGNAVTVARGTLKPSFVRRDINAGANARDFPSGGIRKVGSNPQDALNLIDGDLETSWAPGLGAALQNWFIEIDLGRATVVKRIVVRFAERGDPFLKFRVMVSD